MFFIGWYVVVQVLSLLATPIAFVCFHSCRDRGWAYAKAIGIMVPLYIAWLLAHTGISYSFLLLAFGVLVMAVLSLALLWNRRTEVSDWFRREWRRVAAIEFIFLAALIFFGTVRAYNPEIESTFRGYGSEKFMDIMFVNSVHQSDAFPPHDAWFAGKPVNYYWYGYYVCSALCKLSGIPTHIGYNLALVTIYALTTMMAFALAWHLTGRWWAGLCGALALTVAGNPQGFRLFVGWGTDAVSGVRYIWDCSRVINPPGHTINEFPYFSFLWGDLHGHVTSLPFTVLILACAACLWVKRGDPISTWILAPLLTALAYGTAIACNNWDLPAYAGVIVLTSLVFFPRSPTTRSSLAWAGSATLQRVAVVAVGYAMFLPFFAAFDAPKKSLNWGITTKTPMVEFLSMFGYPALLVGTFLVWLFIRSVLRDKRSVWWTVGFTVAVLVPIGLWASHWHTVRFESATAFDPQKMFLLTGLLLAGLFLLVREILRLLFPGFLERDTADASDTALAPVGTPQSYRFVAIILFVALSILLATEYVAVSDFYGKANERMNTLFKFHFEAWTMLAIAGAWILALMLGRPWVLFAKGSRWLKILWCVPWLVVACFCLTFTVRGTAIKTDRGHPSIKDRVAPTLDGRLWLAREHPEDLVVIQWLLENGKTQDPEKNVPFILEAISGDAYSYFGRISAFTGFPAVLGWPNHEGIWRSHNPEVERRKREGRKIFTSAKLGESCRLAEKYQVDYIILGGLEKKEFRARRLREKFLPHTKEVFAVGETTVRSSWSGPCDEFEQVQFDGIIDRTGERPPVAQQPPPVILTLGEQPGELNEPRGVAFGPDGRLYVTDSRSFRLQVYSPQGVLERAIPDPSDSNPRAQLGGQYGGPSDVAVAADGSVYVADTWGSIPGGGFGRIVKYDPEGKFVTEWAKPNGFYGPRGIAVADDGEVYVADTGNKRVQVFEENGTFIRMWGQEGEGPGEFNEPVGITVQGEQVFVCDTGNHRIQAFTLEGRWLFEFVPYGWGGNVVSVEPHISLDSQGGIYLTDSTQGLVQVFSPQGDPIRKCYGGLSRPTGIDVLGDLCMVAETSAHRVRILSLE